MRNLGVVEGFFGPAWTVEARLSYAQFLANYGAGFYIYAPKQDPYLRKAWREPWSNSYIQQLRRLAQNFQQQGIKFGVGFSPFGLGVMLNPEDKIALKEKLEILNDLKLDILGVFFDDMPTNENLAQTQLDTLSIIQKSFHQKIIFCPTYYTYDPLLEKVFGKKPDLYWEDVANGIQTEIAIAWTGPKVISPSMEREHLVEVARMLKRKPYIWENLYANDGPKNCKFLKLKPFHGRDPDILDLAEAFAFNLMNQPELSKIAFLSSLYVLNGDSDATKAFEKALSDLCSEPLKLFINHHREKFLSLGLDSLTEAEKQGFIKELELMPDLAALEIIDWIQGKYVVGTECLTD